jgi:hypothetical protein
MKKLFLLIAIFSVLLILIGCQDNSITDPFSSGSLKKDNLIHANSFEGSITLDQKLADPDRINEYFLLSGKIKYAETVFNNNFQDKTPQLTAAGQEENLDISVDATLTSLGVFNSDKGVFRIDSKSDDIVFIHANGTDTLVKTYPVLGRKDKLELVVTFDVTENGLKLKDAILTSVFV